MKKQLFFVLFITYIAISVIGIGILNENGLDLKDSESFDNFFIRNDYTNNDELTFSENNESKIVNLNQINSASNSFYAWNYDDDIAETHRSIWNDASNDYQSLSINYGIGSHGYCLTTGVRYKYNNIGIGPYDLNITFWGEDIGGSPVQYGAIYNDNVPQVLSDSWRTFYCTGPLYVIDDDPVVELESSDDFGNNLAICADDPSRSNSYYDLNGAGYFPDLSYEYIVDLLFEEIPRLFPGGYLEGDISGTNFVDAYFINGYSTEINLHRISGSGELKLRLLQLDTLTNNLISETVLNSTEQDENISLGAFNTNTTYVLLVEPLNPGIDNAIYSIGFEEDRILLDGDISLHFWGSGKDGLTWGTAYELSFANTKNIELVHTNAYVIIRNCYFSNSDNTIYPRGVGIHIFTSSNIKIENCIVENNEQEGIWIIGTDYQDLKCENIIISDNKISDNGEDGICVDGDVEDVEIIDNDISNNEKNGISVFGSTIEISGNDISDNDENGILCDGEDIKILDNDISDNDDDGIIVYGDTFEISGNDIKKNNKNGIFIDSYSGEISEQEVSNNKIYENKMYGIHMFTCERIEIIKNTIKNNILNGLFLERSSSNIVSENIFIDNQFPAIIESTPISNTIMYNQCYPDDIIYISISIAAIASIVLIIAYYKNLIPIKILQKKHHETNSSLTDQKDKEPAAS